MLTLVQYLMVQYWIETVYNTQQRLLCDSINKENAIDPRAVVGKDSPLTESPEALALELLHVRLEVVLVLSMVIDVTLPGQQHHQTPYEKDVQHVYD